MTNKPDKIISTGDIANGLGEDEAPQADMSATETPKPDRISFHVNMDGYTMGDMEDLVVKAAAMKLCDRWTGERSLSKKIEETAIAKITEKVDARLATVTAEIIDQSIVKPAFGSGEDVTMRQYIGLVGREYLTARVGHDGEPARNGRFTRIQHIVDRVIDKRLKDEVDKTIAEVKAELHNMLKAAIQQHTDKVKAELRQYAENVLAPKG